MIADFGDIQRKEEINEVSRLSKWLTWRLGTPILWGVLTKGSRKNPRDTGQGTPHAAAESED